jgi:TPR repeat protein
MHKPYRLLPTAALAGLLLSGPMLVEPACARTGAEIAAVFDSGVAAYDAGDYPKAFQIWWDLRYEDIAAMRNLGMMLRKGQGVEKDPKQAKELFLRAARAGLPTAQADLADMLLKGEGAAPDLADALPLLQAAAAAHHPLAQFQLGQLYETGAPPLVPQNLDVARQLYAAAAEHGVKDAADRLRVVGPPATATPLAATPVAATPAATMPTAPAQAAVTPDASPTAAPAPAPAP